MEGSIRALILYRGNSKRIGVHRPSVVARYLRAQPSLDDTLVRYWLEGECYWVTGEEFLLRYDAGGLPEPLTLKEYNRLHWPPSRRART
jgi:hypothetical protein